MHFSEVLPYLTAADVYQRFPPPVGSLSFLTQTLQHEEGQMSWAHNKGFEVISFLWKELSKHLRCFYGAIYCHSVMGEGCVRCVIISALIREK